MNISIVAKLKYNVNDPNLQTYLKKYDLVTTSDQEVFSHLIQHKKNTILVYGESNSGKTFTVKQFLNNLLRSNQLRYPVPVKCVEIYNNDVYDLTFNRKKVKFNHEHQCRVLQNEHLLTLTIQSLLQQRSTKATYYNKVSSRSHMIMCIQDYCIVDLAGHEKSFNNESSFINVSLMHLQNCVKNLQFANYRQNKLTEQLKDHLKRQLCCICTVIPNSTRSANTLKYGLDMKNIKLQYEIGKYDVEKYIQHSKKLYVLETEMFTEYSKSLKSNLTPIMKELLIQRIDLCKYMLNKIK